MDRADHFESPPPQPQELAVAPEEIELWKKQAGIIRTINLEFPRGNIARQVLKGLSPEELSADKRNIDNNRLQLIRPYPIQSVFSFDECYQREYAAYFLKNYSLTGNLPPKIAYTEAIYLELLASYNDFAATVLESLNDNNLEPRKAKVMAKIKEIFQGGFSEVPKISPLETPESWLLYSVLSIVNHPSDRISPLARYRSLELLQLYKTPEEIFWRSKGAPG